MNVSHEAVPKMFSRRTRHEAVAAHDTSHTATVSAPRPLTADRIAPGTDASTAYSIEPLGEQHIAALVAAAGQDPVGTRLAGFRPTLWGISTRVAINESRGNALYLVARRNKNIVGYGTFSGIGSERVPGVWIAPEARGQGLAKSMMTVGIDSMFSQPQVKTVRADVAKSNEASLRLFRGLGFVPHRNSEFSVVSCTLHALERALYGRPTTALSVDRKRWEEIRRP